MGEREPLLRPSIVTVQLEYDSIEQVNLLENSLARFVKIFGAGNCQVATKQTDGERGRWVSVWLRQPSGAGGGWQEWPQVHKYRWTHPHLLHLSWILFLNNCRLLLHLMASNKPRTKQTELTFSSVAILVSSSPASTLMSAPGKCCWSDALVRAFSWFLWSAGRGRLSWPRLTSEPGGGWWPRQCWVASCSCPYLRLFRGCL